MTTIVTRASKGSPLSWSEADANFTNLNDDKAEVSIVNLKAPLNSPNLTGVPTAPTAVNGTNTTQLATTAFVQGKTASQTPSTAVGNIAATTVQAALEELDTEKASLTGATFSGQVTATKLQTGVSGTNTNNFILDASAADGTMKLERGDGQDIMTVDATGKVAFPQLLNSLGASGYAQLPNGLILQWGRYTNSATPGAAGVLTFPIPFPTAVIGVIGTSYGSGGAVVMFGTSSVTGVNSHNSVASGVTQWLALGY